MSPTPVRVLVETTPKKAFASALDWPGLSRAGRDEPAAIEALLATAPRYAEVVRAAGEVFETDELAVEVEERRDGDATTAFGAPSIVADADRRPVAAWEAARLAAIAEASWAAFDRIAAAAPEELRKGPRGGGRDRSRVVRHVVEAEAAYAAVMGRKHRPDDPAALAAMRADILHILRQPSDGSPIAGRRWPPRYAARRIAWHVLDHAWEIEDRSEPGAG
jgi:hypothetical protein